MPIPDIFGFEAATWIRRRDDKMQAARDCRAALIDPDGFWKYAQDSEAVKRAVGVWVAKARECHAIAMGRKPLSGNFVIIGDGQAIVASHVYAGRAA